MPKPAIETRFVLLLEEHKRILYKVANAYCKHSEERPDLVQEMVIQLWRAFPGYDDRYKFSTWMYRIAMNVAISALRRATRHRHDTVPIEQLDVIDFAATDRLLEEAGDDYRLMQQLIGLLDEMSRALIILYLDGHTHGEIAEILGISATNAGTRISRIKQKLHRQFTTQERAGKGARDEPR